jgi:hypothetical protein
VKIPELAQHLMPRIQRLALTDPATDKWDPEEVAHYILVALRHLANRWSLLHLAKLDRHLVRTVAGIEEYQIPASYGFVVPEEPDKSGLSICESDGTKPRNLQWYTPQRYELLRSAAQGRPVRFTLANDKLYLQPTPDGVYLVQAVHEPEITEDYDIPTEYEDAVSAETLYRLACDTGKLTPLLIEERTMTTRTLVNGEARLKTRFANATYMRELRWHGRSRWRR